jgi:signal transduction histidine kinase
MKQVALPGGSSVDEAPAQWQIVALLVALLPALVAAALVSLRSDHLAQPGFRAAYVVASIGAPVLVGVAWWWRRRASRIGPLLVLLGVATWFTAWQASDLPLAFVIGIAGEPVVAFLTLYLALSFPSGRLASNRDRATIGVWSATVAVGWVGAILLVRDLGPAGPLSACIPACPPNPFGAGVASIGGLQLGWAMLAIAAVFVVARTGLTLAKGIASASPARRRELAPVFAASAFYLAALILHHGARFLGPSAPITDATEAMMALARLAFPLAFLASLVKVELVAVRASRRIAEALTAPSSARDIEQRLSNAVRDSDLRLGIWDPREHAYRNSEDVVMSRAATPPNRLWISVRDNGERLAAIETDAAYRATPRLTETLRSAAQIEVNSLAASNQADTLRSRAIQSSDAERTRIARDLHDSAQQRLVALRVQLMLAAENYEALAANRELATRLAADLDIAIEDLRQLARRFLTPAALGNGIAPALRALADNWRVPVTVRARGLERHPAAVELAVYNCCLEALQNVADHAGPAASVDVHIVERKGDIFFAVADDGVGFDPAATERGAGLARIVDRALLAGGCASIRTAPGRGVRVSGLIPGMEPARAA